MNTQQSKRYYSVALTQQAAEQLAVIAIRMGLTRQQAVAAVVESQYTQLLNNQQKEGE